MPHRSHEGDTPRGPRYMEHIPSRRGVVSVDGEVSGRVCIGYGSNPTRLAVPCKQDGIAIHHHAGKVIRRTKAVSATHYPLCWEGARTRRYPHMLARSIAPRNPRAVSRQRAPQNDAGYVGSVIASSCGDSSYNRGCRVFRLMCGADTTTKLTKLGFGNCCAREEAASCVVTATARC